MENAVEALKQAAAVLIFVIAITTAFTMFSKAKTTADSVIRGQDQIEYLEAEELNNILYTSSSGISEEKMTPEGYRVVQPEDVISTIYRYNLEKYGVTIMKEDGTVIARYDSNTESIIRQWNNLEGLKDDEGKDIQDRIAEDIKNNIKNKLVTPTLDKETLENLYKIRVTGNEVNIKCGAPWYGNDAEIITRINKDIKGEKYSYNNQERDIKKYNGQGIEEAIKNKKIVEIVNEIDNSKYIKDNDEMTNLLKDYQMPTIEIIYVLE